MSSVKDFVAGTEFGGASFPEGKSVIDLNQVQVRETEREFDGKKKRRFILTIGGVEYEVGVKVMAGIKQAIAKGASRVEILRQGTGQQTSYVVLPILEQ